MQPWRSPWQVNLKQEAAHLRRCKGQLWCTIASCLTHTGMGLCMHPGQADVRQGPPTLTCIHLLELPPRPFSSNGNGTVMVLNRYCSSCDQGKHTPGCAIHALLRVMLLTFIGLCGSSVGCSTHVAHRGEDHCWQPDISLRLLHRWCTHTRKLGRLWPLVCRLHTVPSTSKSQR